MWRNPQGIQHKVAISVNTQGAPHVAARGSWCKQKEQTHILTLRFFTDPPTILNDNLQWTARARVIMQSSQKYSLLQLRYLWHQVKLQMTCKWDSHPLLALKLTALPLPICRITLCCLSVEKETALPYNWTCLLIQLMLSTHQFLLVQWKRVWGFSELGVRTVAKLA